MPDALQLLLPESTTQGAPTQPQMPESPVYHGLYGTQLDFVNAGPLEWNESGSQSCLEMEQFNEGYAMYHTKRGLYQIEFSSGRFVNVQHY